MKSAYAKLSYLVIKVILQAVPHKTKSLQVLEFSPFLLRERSYVTIFQKDISCSLNIEVRPRFTATQ